MLQYLNKFSWIFYCYETNKQTNENHAPVPVAAPSNGLMALDMSNIGILISNLARGTAVRMRLSRLCCPVYEGVSKRFRTKSIMKYTLTFDITRWEATQSVMATKLTRLTKYRTTAPSDRELYYLQFSLQAASPETFGYSLVDWSLAICHFIVQGILLSYVKGKGKCKVKIVPVLLLNEHHAMKAYWGSGIIAPLILWPRH
jgi:hypothetical protein